MHLCSGSEVFQLFKGEGISDEERSRGHREYSAEHILGEEEPGHTQGVAVGSEGQPPYTHTHNQTHPNTHIALR